MPSRLRRYRAGHAFAIREIVEPRAAKMPAAHEKGAPGDRTDANKPRSRRAAEAEAFAGHVQ